MMLNERVFGPQRLYPAEPGWRMAFFRDGPEQFEFYPVVFWALVVEEFDEWDDGLIHSHIAPVVIEDGRPCDSAMDDDTFYSLFAPGEELAPDDLAEREDYFEAKKRQSKRPTAEEER